MLTVKKIENLLSSKRNAKERLNRGKGFFFFSGGVAPKSSRPAVFVKRVNELDESGWIQAYDEMLSAVGVMEKIKN